MDLKQHRIAPCGAWTLASALLLSGAAAFAAPFRSNLNLQGYSFAVSASGEGSIPQLSVKARRGTKALPAIQESLEGPVVGAEVADLNSDGLPDLFVFVRSAGSGTYGSVGSWATTSSEPGDSNAKPSGGTRQVSYKLVPGEAMWLLKPGAND